MSITRSVEKIIRNKPFLQEALVKGIINYGGLADELISDIEKEIGKKVQHAAVMMALRRLSEKLEKKPMTLLKFSENTSLIARDSLVEVTVEKSKKTLDKIKELFNKVDYAKGDFLTVTQGMYEITIITNKNNLKWLLKNFKKEEIVAVLKNLSALTLTIPLEFTETQGFFYQVTKALSWEGINIKEIVSTTRELTCLVNSEDISRAFDTLKKLVR
ncbi:hypothetical protein COV11_02650 [Candidatus Woesearchaeota archaeon CG10_big_fil_rev_8_21_14_0_10_30_7]|nr:MAG: hypothetical protein COV11_02650 [Candidatus Woesearchaeota archaeon CG10_big_fil_rev_8_21_14_0_10_30_7]